MAGNAEYNSKLCMTLQGFIVQLFMPCIKYFLYISVKKQKTVGQFTLPLNLAI